MYHVDIFGRNKRLLDFNLCLCCCSLFYPPAPHPCQKKVKRFIGSLGLILVAKGKKRRILSRALGLSHDATAKLSFKKPGTVLSALRGLMLSGVSSPTQSSMVTPGSCSAGHEAKTSLPGPCQHLTILFPSVSISFPLHGQRL